MNDSIAYDDYPLLKKIAEGDESAFRTVFEDYSDRIYSVAFNFTKSRETSQELVQDVFLKIWTKREELTGIDNFESYLFIIARNFLISYLRSQKRSDAFLQRLAKHFSEKNLSPQDQLIKKESLALISHTIDQLPEQQKKVYHLRRDEGLSVDEIAQKLGLSPNTVRNHMNAALRFIRERLKDHPDELLVLFYLAFIFCA